MQEIKLVELVALLEKKLTEEGYHQRTIQGYNRSWRYLVECFNVKGEEFFSLSVAMRILDESYDFFKKREQGTVESRARELYRSICLLNEYNQFKVTFRRSFGTMHTPMSETNAGILDGFQLYCACNYARYTIEGYGRSARKLLLFVEGRGITIENLTPEILNDFVKTLFGYSPKMVEFTFSGVKCFLKYLHEEGHLTSNLSEALPKVKVPQKPRIPSVWEEDTLRKLIETIDRGNPSGKRNYAIILLASMLGMRCVDIRKLTFQNINWGEQRIDIIQSKSKRPVSYPLLPAIGWAIIDYVKHGRPECDCPEVFVSHDHHVHPLSCAATLDGMIKRYMKSAHITVPQDRKYGMHSLRHTYATSLMEKHYPIEEIAQLMGHVSPNTTAIYLKSSIGLLSECALTIDES